VDRLYLEVHEGGCFRQLKLHGGDCVPTDRCRSTVVAAQISLDGRLRASSPGRKTCGDILFELVCRSVDVGCRMLSVDPSVSGKKRRFSVSGEKRKSSVDGRTVGSMRYSHENGEKRKSSVDGRAVGSLIYSYENEKKCFAFTSWLRIRVTCTLSLWSASHTCYN
jgi:hypothetical protein